jgi:hypothetical protein
MKKIPIHLFIFTWFPVMSLYLKNAEKVPFQEVTGVLAIVSASAALLWLLAYRVTRDGLKSSVMISILSVLFFSHHHAVYALSAVARLLKGVDGAIAVIESELVPILWLCVWIALFGLAVYAIIKSQMDFSTITSLLNVAAISLAAVLLLNWVTIQMGATKTRAYLDDWQDQVHSDIRGIETPAGSLPDIYYIILDGYARSDILEEYYQADNSEFLSYLVEKGFYVAQESRSNYAQTALSLSSSLNCTYLDGLADRIGAESASLRPLRALIARSRAVQILNSQGYAVVAFSTGYPLSELRDADAYLSPAWIPNGFQSILMNSTPIPILLELPFLKTQYDMHRERTLHSLDHIADATQIEAPTFVFAHILAPHPPFVFGENGEPIQPGKRTTVAGNFTLADGQEFTSLSVKGDYVEDYREQLAFITHKVQTVVQEILANSPDPPIIIVQADHGPGSMLDWRSMEDSNLPERLSILNAYYFPTQNYESLHPGITPVNTFRVILNNYFGMDYPMLGDRSYYSTPEQPYLFFDVTEQISSGN